MEAQADSSEPRQVETDQCLSPDQERELLEAHRDIQTGLFVDGWDLVRELKASLDP